MSERYGLLRKVRFNLGATIRGGALLVEVVLDELRKDCHVERVHALSSQNGFEVGHRHGADFDGLFELRGTELCRGQLPIRGGLAILRRGVVVMLGARQAHEKLDIGQAELLPL